MPNLSILNTLIAMVVVILVLSLIVQSLQTLIKKFFKLKSRTLLYSLEDLFETIIQSPSGEEAADPGKAQQLVRDVTDKLRQMGRETLRGKPMLDSLAKGDLLKVLTRVEAQNLLPGVVGRFENVLKTIRTLTGELKSINAALLEGDASAKFAAMQAALLPIVDDIEALVTSGGEINPRVLLGDLNRLRQIRAAEVLGLLGEVQKKVGEDLAAARARKAPDAELEALDGVSEGLKKIAEQITALGQAFDAAIGPLRERLGQAELWYDTVMQGFEERYTRHMRTVALVISIVVVVVLNANFFSVYRAIASDPVKTAALADQAPEILKQAREATGTQDGTTNDQPSNASPTPAPSASPAETPVTVEDLKKQGEKVSELVGTYKSFGIEPLTWEQFYNGVTFRSPAGDIFETLVGWIVMVILLSAGAPFWQDTLESLFGLKNLLRQRSDTRNVEGEKGGQPQP
jgi:hypothetical protein